MTGASENTVIVEGRRPTRTVCVIFGVGRLRQLHNDVSEGMMFMLVGLDPSSKILSESATVTMRLVGAAGGVEVEAVIGGVLVGGVLEAGALLVGERTSITPVTVFVIVIVVVSLSVAREIEGMSVPVVMGSVAVKVTGCGKIVDVVNEVIGLMERSVEQKLVASGRLLKSFHASVSAQDVGSLASKAPTAL